MKSFLRVTKNLLSIFAEHKKILSIYFSLLLVTSIVANLQPFLYKFFIDTVTKSKAIDIHFLLLIVAAIASVQLISGVLTELTLLVFDTGFSWKSVFALHLKVFSHIQDLSFSFHQNKRSGSLISAMSRGKNAYISYIFNIFFSILSFLITLTFLIVIMSFINPKVTIAIIVTAIVYVLCSIYILKENIQKRNEANNADDVLGGIIADNFVTHETVKYYRQENYEKELVKRQRRNWVDTAITYANTYRKFGIMNATVTGLGIFISLAVVLPDVASRAISLGTFVLILSFVTQLYNQLQNVFFQFREIAKNFSDLERYMDMLEIPIEMSDPQTPHSIEDIQGNVAFNHVIFAYKGRAPVLEDVSFSVNTNMTAAIVGRSGAGKTTISKLLLRLYDVTDGSITIDGIDIKSFAQSDLKHLIGIVPQEPLLFNQSIQYNIAYAKPEATLAEVKQAAKLAYLDTFIESLPLKYDTEVGERGIKLSGGQKQRLAIARTIIQNPKVLIFDEATSHLDSESEFYIQKALSEISKEKSVIIIAHRLSTVMHADTILVFEEGKLIDQGTHSELINKQSELYKKLWNLQSSGELETGVEIHSNTLSPLIESQN